MGKKAKPRQLGENEEMATGPNLRVSAQKLNLVAQLIRGKNAEKALADLKFSRRRIAEEVHKILESAIANAENNHQLDVDRLYVAEATVGHSFVMKRWSARGRGRAGRIQKPFSHIRLVVREREEKAEETA